MATEYLTPEERTQSYEDLYEQIKDRILEYRETTGEFVDPAVDFVNQRALFAEGYTWRRRRDAFDVTSLYRSVQRMISEIEEQGRISKQFPIDYEPGNHGFIAKTAVFLLRQQIFNWNGEGGEIPLITLYDVQASLQRQFYGNYLRQMTQPSPLVRIHLDGLYDTHAVVTSAIAIEHAFDFEPTQAVDVLRWGKFLGDITYVG